MDVSPGRVILAIGAVFAVVATIPGCSGTADPTGYRVEEPSPYYIYPPKAYTPDRAWPLFISVAGSGSDGRTCWDTWQRHADEKGYVLLCPELTDPDGQLHQLRGNSRLLEILGRVYEDYSLQPRIFLAGFSAGAQFVHGYAFMNPNYVVGVSVIAAGNYYRPPDNLSYIPFEVIVGERDDPLAIERAVELASLLNQSGYRVGLHVLPGVGHEISDEAIQITLDQYDRTVGSP